MTNEKMRIFVVSMDDLSAPGAPKTHLMEKWTCIADQGHEIHLWAFRRDIVASNWKNIIVREVPHLSVRGFRSISYQIFLLISLLINSLKRKPDVIYVRNALVDFAPLAVSIILNIPLVIEFPSPILEETEFYGVSHVKFLFIQFLLRLKFQRAAKIITVTEPIKRNIQMVYDIKPEKVHVVSNGANTALFKPIDQHLAKQLLGLLQQKTYVGFVGSLYPWHGVDVLVAASIKVMEACPNIIFLIVGDGVMKARLERQVTEIGMAKNFMFTGAVPYSEVPYYIASCDLMTLPLITKASHDSGYSPLKLYEYMACAKPVVASRLVGLECLEEQRAGILVEPNNSDALADAIVTLLNDHVSLKQMGNRGRRLVVEQFDWQIVANKTERLIRF